MIRHQIVGSEGGLQHVIFIFWRKPWSVYFTVKTPWIGDRGWRIRIEFGRQNNRVQFVSFTRRRCADCREVVWNDVEECGNCGFYVGPAV